MIFTHALIFSHLPYSTVLHVFYAPVTLAILLFFWVAVTFLASYAIWEHVGEVRHSNILAMVLGDSWLVYALCVRVSVQRSDFFDVILGWLSGVPCFGLRSSCVLWMTRLKKGVKSKRLIQGHYTGEEGQGQLVKRGPAFLANTWQRWILHSNGCARYGGPAAATFCKDAWKI